MTPLRIVDDFAAPRFDHTYQNMRELRTADTVFGKHLGIMTADMFNHFQRFAGCNIIELKLRLAGYLIPEFVNNVAGMSNGFRQVKLAAGCLEKILPGLCKQLRKMFPGLQYLGINAE